MAKYTSEFTGIEIDERLSKVNEEFTSEEKEKLATLENYDDSEILAAVEDKVDKVEGKGLSTNDFTDEEKNKLSTLENYDDSGITKSIEDLEENKANKNEVYNKEETDTKITEKVAEIVAGAPEEFNTLKEMSDWLTEHEDSAATMNTAILKNKEDIADNTEAIEGNTADIEQNKSDILKAEKAIEINQRSIGMQASKNLFDLKNWEKSLIGATRGQVEAIENGIKFTHDNSSTATAYTNPYLDSNSKTYKIPVEANTEYILSWETNTVNSGFIRVYFNGQSTYYEDVTNTGNINSKKFKTPSVTRYLSLQLRIDTAGESTTFTNIMIREADIADDTYEPYVPSVNERLTANENDILSLEENKLNFAYFVAQNTTTTAGWYEVAKCDVVPSGGGNVRDITLCVQLTNANSTVGAKWAILNVATVISGNSAGSTIDTMVVKFIVNNGFNTSEENPDIVVVGTTEGETVKLAIWCKLQVQYAYCRGIPLIDAARISIKQFNTPNYWQMLNTTAKYDSYPTDWERKIIPTDYYGGQLKSLSDRITALENK